MTATNGKYRIRRAHLSDCGRLAEIWEKAVRETHYFLSVEDFEYYRSKLPEYFDLVALFALESTDGAIQGFAGIDGDKLEMLFVEERGRGTGSALLEFAVKERGVSKVDVNAQNTAAVEFYKRHGFRETAVSPVDGEGRPYPIIHMETEPARPAGHPHGGGHPGGHPGAHGHMGGHKR